MSICDLQVEGPMAAPTGLPEGVPPLRAFYLYMTTGCNLRCRHCWVVPRFVKGEPDPGEIIDPQHLERAVMEAKPLGLCSAKITGGEPLLHPQFREIVKMLSDQGLGLNVETNGTLMTRDLARWLKECSRVGFISVSLDGPDAAAHDGFRGVSGAFDAALSGLDALVEAGYRNVQVIMSVYRGNVSQIDDVVALAKAHGAGSVKFTPVTNTGRGTALHEGGEALGLEERMDLAKYIQDDLARRADINLVINLPPALRTFKKLWQSRGRTGDCGVQRILGILGSGEIAMCGIGRTIPELVYGRLGEDSIHDIWLGHPRILQLRRELENVAGYLGVCGTCLHASSCRTGCVANNYVEGDHMVCPSASCTEAESLGIFPKERQR
ncbi:MAG: radical SAM protein [Methanothrix sp.]|nr:radical SAM protein [Methanothrix sp.]